MPAARAKGDEGRVIGVARRVSFRLGLAFLGIVAAGLLLSYFYVEILWFSEVGYSQVFFKTLYSKLAAFAIGFAAAAAFVYLNLLTVRRRSSPYVSVGAEQWKPISVSSLTGRLFAAVSALVGLGIGLGASAHWLEALKFIGAVPFGVSEPLHGLDAGFYVFRLPFLTFLHRSATSVAALTLAACALLYAATGALSWSSRVVLSHKAKAHLLVLGSLLLALKAYGYRISMFHLLYSPRGVGFGPSYTDVHAQLPASWASLAAALIGAGILLYAAFSRRKPWRLVLTALGLPVFASLMLGVLYPAFVQQFQVAPDEIVREEPYISHNIRLTRLAYGLDRVIEREYPADAGLAYEDIASNGATVANLRIWDWRALKDTYSQLQEMRTYYKFNDVDVLRYRIGDDLRQVYIAARELDKQSLTEAAQTWMNLRLKFTHGYGVVMSPGSEATEEGLPAFWVKDIPPRSTIEGIALTRPEVYFGELTWDYVIVNSKEEEFDYPVGDQARYGRYEGKGGIALSSLPRRAIFSLWAGSYELLLSQAVTPESRIMIRRQILQRVKAIAPFLTYDSDPYLVLASDGKLYWIVDGYTKTSFFPYSEPSAGGFNYIRNSVKAVIDAYDGAVGFYAADPADPILQALWGIFPSLFSPLEDMPADLELHLRYPEDLFLVQSEMYATYHMKDPRSFYNKEDMWALPNEIFGTEPVRMDPYYTVLKVPGESEPEFVLMIPFTPTQRLNMIGWLAARCDTGCYGDLILFKFPKHRVVYGPMQVEARIDQEPGIAQQLTLWGQGGSQVIRGNLLAIPVDSSLIYVEPLYLRAKDTNFPEFERVIVAYEDRIVMESSVAAALRQVFGAAEADPPGFTPDPTGETSLRELAEKAARLYGEAYGRLREGDLAGFGRSLEELGRILELIRQSSTGG